jgi:hypothetical protein
MMDRFLQRVREGISLHIGCENLSALHSFEMEEDPIGQLGGGPRGYNIENAAQVGLAELNRMVTIVVRTTSCRLVSRHCLVIEEMVRSLDIG